jgi:hypothetical protein
LPSSATLLLQLLQARASDVFEIFVGHGVLVRGWDFKSYVL